MRPWFSPHRVALVALLATVCAAPCPAADPPSVAEPPSAAEPPRADAVRAVVRDARGERTLTGTVVVEAADGGLLIELPDQRYELVEPEALAAREAVAAGAALTPREVGTRILAELPPGFRLHVTRHYVVCHDTAPEYAKWAAALLERLRDGFENYWRLAGLEPVPASGPLVVVIFADRRAYEAFAARDLGAAADRVCGYYNLLTNRVTTYDLTGSDALRAAAGRPARLAPRELLARPEAAGLVATLVHEATHQVAFNTGMHRRLAPVPLWVSEGIATYFETPDLRNDRGWRGIGAVNRPRLDRFRAAHRPGDLEALVVDDERLRDTETALDAYASAWALTWFLAETRRDDFVAYLKLLAAKVPCTEYPRDERLRDFERAFGGPPADVERALLRHMARLPVGAP